MEDFTSETTLAEVWRFAERRLGGLDAVDFGRDIVEKLTCAGCGRSEDLLLPADKVSEQRVACPNCGADRLPQFVQSVGAGSKLLDRTVRQTGLPPWDILWAHRNEEVLGVEIAGDRR